MRRCGLLLATILACSCTPAPDGYPIPEQHVSPDFKEGAAEFVDAADIDADRFFVKDIKPSEGGPWRWTHDKPELRFIIGPGNGDRRLTVEFTINEVTFKETGPVAISFFVNGQLVAKERYTSPGDKKFSQVIHAEMLYPGEENRVLMQVHDAWQTPYPGIKYGFLFRRAGLGKT
jgi:hypothetical protein